MVVASIAFAWGSVPRATEVGAPADTLLVTDFGAALDGITDDSAALAAAAVAAVRADKVVAITGPLFVNGPVVLDGARLRGVGDGVLIAGTAPRRVFQVASGFSLQNLTVQANATFSDAERDAQIIFYAPKRATGVAVSDVRAFANVAGGTGASRGGELFHGYFAESVFVRVRTTALRNGIVAEGENISGITVADCTFEDVERGVYLTGRNPHAGNELVSHRFVLSNNRLVNTPTQARHYVDLPGRNLYNLQNVGDVTIVGGTSENAMERAVYGIATDAVRINGLEVRGSEGIKFSGTQFDGSVPGGPVDRKATNIHIAGLRLTHVPRDRHGIILSFVEGVTIDDVVAEGEGSTPHAAIYVESFASRVRIHGVKARGFKRGLVWFRAFADLPGGGVVPRRPSGSYRREFRDITIEECEGLGVSALGVDPAYTPPRQVPFIYSLLEDDLAATLSKDSKIFYGLRIHRNRAGSERRSVREVPARRASTTPFLDIDYVSDLVVEGNASCEEGGVLGITIGSANTNVRIQAEGVAVTRNESAGPRTR